MQDIILLTILTLGEVHFLAWLTLGLVMGLMSIIGIWTEVTVCLFSAQLVQNSSALLLLHGKNMAQQLPVPKWKFVEWLELKRKINVFVFVNLWNFEVVSEGALLYKSISRIILHIHSLHSALNCTHYSKQNNSSWPCQLWNNMDLP